MCAQQCHSSTAFHFHSSHARLLFTAVFATAVICAASAAISLRQCQYAPCPQGWRTLSKICVQSRPYREMKRPVHTTRTCSFTRGCKWCNEFSGCVPSRFPCRSSCEAIKSTGVCNRPALVPFCQWCLGQCRPYSTQHPCYKSCKNVADETKCNNTQPQSCAWCKARRKKPCRKKNVCGSCLMQETFDECASSSSACKWCPEIETCVANGTSCFSNCSDATVDPAVCDAIDACEWSETLGVCYNTSMFAFNDDDSDGVGLESCLQLSEFPDVCSASHVCSMCHSSAPNISYCGNKSEACLNSCNDINQGDPDVCLLPSINTSCQWCEQLQYCTDKDATCTSACAKLPPSACGIGSGVCQWCPHAQQLHGRCQDAFLVSENQTSAETLNISEGEIAPLTCPSLTHSMSPLFSRSESLTLVNSDSLSPRKHTSTLSLSDPVASASITIFLTSTPAHSTSPSELQSGTRMLSQTRLRSATFQVTQDTVTSSLSIGGRTESVPMTRGTRSLSRNSRTSNTTFTATLLHASATPTSTIPLPPLPAVVPLVVAASQAVVASVSLAASFVAAGAAASASLQATLSSSQCSAAALANAGGDDDPMLAASRNPSMYLVSPFVFSRSSYAMIGGNVALVLLAAAVHWWAVAFAGRSDLDTASTVLRRCVEWRFPSFTMIFAKLMMQGVVLGGWQLLWAALVGDDRQGSAALCVVAALASFCVSFALPWWVLRVRRDLLACDGASRYSRGVPLEAVQIDYGLFARTERIVRACGPTVFWAPRVHRLMLGSAFNDYGVAGVRVRAWYWMSVWLLPMVVSAASAARPPASARAALCNTLMLLVFAVMLAYAAAVAVLAPYRLRCKNPLQGVISVWLGLTCLLSCPLTNTHLGAKRVAVALGVVGVLQSVTIFALAIFELLSFVHVDVPMSLTVSSDAAAEMHKSDVLLIGGNLKSETRGVDDDHLEGETITEALWSNGGGLDDVLEMEVFPSASSTAEAFFCENMLTVNPRKSTSGVGALGESEGDDEWVVLLREECKKDFTDLLCQHMDVERGRQW